MVARFPALIAAHGTRDASLLSMQGIRTGKHAAWSDTGALGVQIGTIIAFVVMVVVNALANSLPLGGRTTQTLAALHPDPFSPADYAFSIWSVIYGGLLAYIIFQALPEQRHNRRLVALAPWFWASCAANVAWLFFWHYEQILASLVTLAVLVACVAGGYRALHRDAATPGTAERWCVHFPLSLYLGWVVVAVLANFAVWGTDARLDAAIDAPRVWAILSIVAATIAAGVMGWWRRDFLFDAAVLWALVGIVVRYGVPHPVSTVALGGAVIVAAVMVRALYLQRRPRALS
jgi:benzodiazapine receptor